MSILTLRRSTTRQGPETGESPAFVFAAILAVLEGEPMRPVELVPGTCVSAGAVVLCLSDDLRAGLDRLEHRSVRSDVVERIAEYTGAMRSAG